MKRAVRLISAMAIAVVLVLNLSVSAYAAGSSVTFKGPAEGFEFQPGSEYTATDLFENFKNVMPGDALTEEVTVTYSGTGSKYIKVYMRAEAHDETENPLSPGVAETGETVATMSDFLAQLSMSVYNGDKLIYEASPDKLDGLAQNVLIGELQQGDSVTLRVQLEVPITLENKYANRTGEVDWVFTVEEVEKQPTDPSLPQTGQLNWPVPVLAACGLAVFAFGWYLRFGRKKETYEE